MRQLNNTPSDREKMQQMLQEGKVKITAHLGYFDDNMKLRTFAKGGYITDIDMESGYVYWEDLNGNKMSPVCIDIIEL